MKIIVDTMYTTVDFEGNTLLKEKVQYMAHHELGVKVDGAQYSPAYRNGVWDGISDFYDMKENKFHTGLLSQFLEGLRKLMEKDPNIKYEIEDVRPSAVVHPDSIDEKIVLGNGDEEPITLRDYQYDSVKAVFREQVGIVNVATNGGKCLVDYSNLITSKGVMTLREFFLQAGEDTNDRGEKVVPYTGDIALVNRYGKFEKPTHLTFNGTRKVREIRGHRGTKNVVTLNHPLLVVDTDGTFVWKKSQDIKVGDYLVGRVGDNVYGSNSLVQSEEEAYALGAIIAEGYIGRDHLIEFTTNKPEISARLRKYLLGLTDKPNYNLYTEKTQTTADQFRLHDKKAVVAWHEKFDIAYGVAKDKCVPQCILESPKHIQLAFLSGYLESECSINKQKGCIDVTSASYTLINQVNLMLRNMGFVPTVRKKVVKGYESNDYYVLALGSTDSIALLEELTFISDKRKKQLEDYYEAVSQRKRNNKKEAVPFGKALAESYRESYRKEDVPKGFRKKFTIPSSISKSRLRSLIEEFPNGDRDMLAVLNELTSDHYVYEEVVEVKDIGEVPTFDVHMPETHSFISDGIINHNTEIASGFMQQVLPYLKRGERIAFFTHSKEIFHQSAERIGKRLNLKPREIGKIGDGKFDIKNKKIVFVMVPTLVSALKDPKKGIKFTQKERVIKFIAEEITPKFRNTKNTRQLLRNYIKNCKLTTQIWKSAEEQLMYIAYDNKFTDKSAQMQLNKYVVEFDKIMEKKNKNKYKKYKDTMEFIESVKVMIADEVHHSKAETWFSSLSLCNNATYRVGLTGTVDKKDKMGWQRLQAIFNQVVVRVSNEFLIDKGISSKPTIRLLPIQEPRDIELVGTYLEAYKRGIVENELRNKVIVDLAEGYRKKRPGGILISVKEIDHGDRILSSLRERGIEVEFIHGGSDADHRSRQLERFSKGDLKILVASTIIDEGVDMKSIGCMILAAGGKSMRQQLQRIGRGLRLNGIDGNSVMVFDFYDQTNSFLLRHSNERIKIFKEENFDVKVVGK
ncbi:putative intein containing helicase/endonuclease protein [Bacillus phage vB_BspH_TimeGriffin]|nr:putative intein containing helicase/endonuclease protein [Bacillus phage vB_BspH_TimeGriffin]